MHDWHSQSHSAFSSGVMICTSSLWFGFITTRPGLTCDCSSSTSNGTARKIVKADVLNDEDPGWHRPQASTEKSNHASPTAPSWPPASAGKGQQKKTPRDSYVGPINLSELWWTDSTTVTLYNNGTQARSDERATKRQLRMHQWRTLMDVVYSFFFVHGRYAAKTRFGRGGRVELLRHPRAGVAVVMVYCLE